jgi:hypothetical protein
MVENRKKIISFRSFSYMQISTSLRPIVHQNSPKILGIKEACMNPMALILDAYTNSFEGRKQHLSMLYPKILYNFHVLLPTIHFIKF